MNSKIRALGKIFLINDMSIHLIDIELKGKEIWLWFGLFGMKHTRYKMVFNFKEVEVAKKVKK